MDGWSGTAYLSVSRLRLNVLKKRVHGALVDLPEVDCIADDVLITPSGDDLPAATASLNDNVARFSQHCCQKGIVLNPEKFEHAVTSVSFMEHLLTSTGLQPDPQKVDAILNMPKSWDVAAVRYNGTVNYLSKFLPSLSAVIKLPTILTCKDVAWTWVLSPTSLSVP